MYNILLVVFLLAYSPIVSAQDSAQPIPVVARTVPHFSLMTDIDYSSYIATQSARQLAFAEYYQYMELSKQNTQLVGPIMLMSASFVAAAFWTTYVIQSDIPPPTLAALVLPATGFVYAAVKLKERLTIRREVAFLRNKLEIMFQPNISTIQRGMAVNMKY